MDIFTVRTMSIGMKLDALVTSHPIYIEVEHPDEIIEIFDSITYKKVRTFWGSSCLSSTFKVNCGV